MAEVKRGTFKDVVDHLIMGHGLTKDKAKAEAKATGVPSADLRDKAKARKK